MKLNIPEKANSLLCYPESPELVNSGRSKFRSFRSISVEKILIYFVPPKLKSNLDYNLNWFTYRPKLLDVVFPLLFTCLGCMFCTFCWWNINRCCYELHVKNANTCMFFDWFFYLWDMFEEEGLKPLLLPQIQVEPNLLKLNYLVSKKHVPCSMVT